MTHILFSRLLSVDMFNQDLSFLQNLLSQKDRQGRATWSPFYEKTFSYGQFESLLKRKRLSVEEAEIICPGTPFASNPAFRLALFKYVKKLRSDHKQGFTMQLATHLINLPDKWVPVFNEKEYRRHHLESLSMQISLRSFNNAFKANNLSLNDVSISSYTLRNGNPFNAFI